MEHLYRGLDNYSISSISREINKYNHIAESTLISSYNSQLTTGTHNW